MAWKPNITRPTRVTLAIATTTERFTQTDIVQRAGAVKGTVSAILKEMERHGMIEVCRIGQHGIKIWRKTEKYRAPSATAPDAKTPEHRRTETDPRGRQAQTCLTQLETAMRGWQVAAPCA
ncbi:MAG: helix-turn-helix domain-containing protein [Sulfuricellaceae bacterium]